MAKLVLDGAFVPDPWRRLADGEPVPRAGDVIVDRDRWLQIAPARFRLGRTGVEIDADSSISELAALRTGPALVVIRASGLADGRGFSLARMLRRSGFRGDLRASGPFIPDQYAFALECEFDEVEIPDEVAERHPEPLWRQARIELTLTYQPASPLRRSISEARAGSGRGGRAGAPPGSAGAGTQARETAADFWWAHW